MDFHEYNACPTWDRVRCEARDRLCMPHARSFKNQYGFTHAHELAPTVLALPPPVPPPPPPPPPPGLQQEAHKGQTRDGKKGGDKGCEKLDARSTGNWIAAFGWQPLEGKGSNNKGNTATSSADAGQEEYWQNKLGDDRHLRGGWQPLKGGNKGGDKGGDCHNYGDECFVATMTARAVQLKRREAMETSIDRHGDPNCDDPPTRRRSADAATSISGDTMFDVFGIMVAVYQRAEDGEDKLVKLLPDRQDNESNSEDGFQILPDV